MAQSIGRDKPRRKLSGNIRAQRRFVATTLTPMLIYMAAFTFLPIVWAVALAFFKYSATRVGGPILGLGGNNPFVGLEHFREMFIGTSRLARQFRTSLVNTLIFSFLVLPLNLMITLPLAAMIESVHDRVKSIFRAIYFLPVVTSSVGVAVMWGYIYHPQQGLLNAIIRALGGQPVAWLSNPRAYFLGVPVAMWAVIVAYIWQDMGYNTVIFIAALQGIPKVFKEAALVDGANPRQVFFKITIPLLRPTLLLVCVLTMISSFQVFDIIQVMTMGGPNDQTRVLVLDIYEHAFRYQRMGWASAISMVLFILVFIITIIQMRLLRTSWEY